MHCSWKLVCAPFSLFGGGFESSGSGDFESGVKHFADGNLDLSFTGSLDPGVTDSNDSDFDTSVVGFGDADLNTGIIDFGGGEEALSASGDLDICALGKEYDIIAIGSGDFWLCNFESVWSALNSSSYCRINF